MLQPARNTFGPRPHRLKKPTLENESVWQLVTTSLAMQVNPQIGEELNEVGKNPSNCKHSFYSIKKLICLSIGSTHHKTKAIRSNDSEGSDVAKEDSAPRYLWISSSIRSLVQMLDNVQVCELQNRRQVEIDLMVDQPKIVFECHKRNDPNTIIVIFANLPLKNCMRHSVLLDLRCVRKNMVVLGIL